MTTCPKCGKEVPDSQRFCGNCGTEVKKPATTATSATPAAPAAAPPPPAPDPLPASYAFDSSAYGYDTPAPFRIPPIVWIILILIAVVCCCFGMMIALLGNQIWSGIWWWIDPNGHLTPTPPPASVLVGPAGPAGLLLSLLWTI